MDFTLWDMEHFDDPHPGGPAHGPCFDPVKGDEVHTVNDFNYHPDGCSCLECGMYFGAGFFFGLWT